MVKTLCTRIDNDDVVSFDLFLRERHLLHDYALVREFDTHKLMIQFYDSAELSYFIQFDLDNRFLRENYRST